MCVHACMCLCVWTSVCRSLQRPERALDPRELELPVGCEPPDTDALREQQHPLSPLAISLAPKSVSFWGKGEEQGLRQPHITCAGLELSA